MAADELDTREYRLAVTGKGPQAYQWQDKPHRLVYDLCCEVERLQALTAQLQTELEDARELVDPMEDVEDLELNDWLARRFKRLFDHNPDKSPDWINGVRACWGIALEIMNESFAAGQRDVLNSLDRLDEGAR
jgi:hypothetical protein